MKLKSFNENGVRRAGLYFALFIASFVVVSVLLQTVSSEFTASGSAASFAFRSFAAPLALASVLIFARKLFSEDAMELCKAKRYSRSFTGLALFLSFGMLFGLGFVNDAVNELLKAVGIKAPVIDVAMDNAGDYILCIFSLCVIPAVAEELFFRGVLMSSLKDTGIVASSLISALFFAFYHCSPAQLVYQFIFGFFLAVLARRAGSVFPAVISHFLNNFAVLSFAYFGITVNFYNALFIILGIAYLATFAFVLTIFTTERSPRDKKSASAAFFPLGIIGLAVCALLTVINLFL